MVKIINNIFKKEKTLSKEDTIYNIVLNHVVYDDLKQIEIFLNGKKIKIKNWDKKITEDDLLEIFVNPLAYVAIIKLVVELAVIAYVLKKLYNPKLAELPKGESVYNFQNNSIRAKIGHIIPEIFGEFKISPNLISPPYVFYKDNEEYTIFTTSIGIGNYYINGAYFGENNVSKILADNKCKYGRDSVIKCLNQSQENFKCFKIAPEKFTKVSDIEFIGKQLSENYSYVINDVKALNNLNIMIDNEWSDPVPLQKYDDKTKKVEIDVSLPNGLYNTDSDGDIHSETISFDYNIIEYRKPYSSANYEDKIIKKSGNISITDKKGKEIRQTFYIDLDTPGKYYIQFKNNSDIEGSIHKKNNNYIIKRVKAHLDISDDITVNYPHTGAIILVKSCAAISKLSKTDIQLKVERKKIKTLGQVVSYIWEKVKFSSYDLRNVDKEKLEKPCNAMIDTKNSVFDALNSILRSYRMSLIPSLNGLLIKEETIKPVRTYIYDKSKIKKNSLSISGSFDMQKEHDGVNVKYYNEKDILSEEKYPMSSRNPENIIMVGPTNRADALSLSKIGFNKKLYNAKNAVFTTELEGFIPSLEDRIGIAEYYIKESYSAVKIATDNNLFVLDKEIFISEEGDNYCIIRTIDGIKDGYYKVLTNSGWTNKVELEGLNPNDFIDGETGLIIGLEQAYVADYVVKKIEVAGKNEIKITAENYDERAYQ